MSEVAINVAGLGKCYRLGSRGQLSQYATLRELIVSAAHAPFGLLRRATGGHSAAAPDLWALKDVAFDVHDGEAIGIMGRNGAGKSTLLKILSRITEPSTGYADVYGRVGSLLEVGTGFHPELTGRENIFLNGAILGMSRADVARKFDEIVDFAEIEQFLDTPVKRYSSGMYMRLAFSVAAHLEPDILVVDEVLAVGDAEFQQKCLGKMGQVAGGGRTVLFVSHNLAALTELCSTGLWLDHGQVKAHGPIPDVARAYMSDLRSTASVPLVERIDRVGDGRIRFTRLHFEDSSGHIVSAIRSGDDCNIVFGYVCERAATFDDVVVAMVITDRSGRFILHHRSNFTNQLFQGIPCEGEFVCRLYKLPLAYGQYSVNAHVGINEVASDSIYNAGTLLVEPGDFFGTGHQGMPDMCPVLNDADWSLRGRPPHAED